LFIATKIGFSGVFLPFSFGERRVFLVQRRNKRFCPGQRPECPASGIHPPFFSCIEDAMRLTERCLRGHSKCLLLCSENKNN
jgi:hypothetical protein